MSTRKIELQNSKTKNPVYSLVSHCQSLQIWLPQQQSKVAQHTRSIMKQGTSISDLKAACIGTGLHNQSSTDCVITGGKESLATTSP